MLYMLQTTQKRGHIFHYQFRASSSSSSFDYLLSTRYKNYKLSVQNELKATPYVA